MKNIGIDTVDKFAGTVAISGGESKSFSAVNLKPLTTRQITVNINMKKCYENITVSYYATDGGKDFGSGSSPGHREIPSNLSSLWGQGSSASVYAAIEYHFGKNGREVAASDIVTYATKAKTYRDQVISDLAIYSNATLSTIYKITVSTNPTPGHKYKHLTNNQYIILSDSGRKILSYGI